MSKNTSSTSLVALFLKIGQLSQTIQKKVGGLSTPQLSFLCSLSVEDFMTMTDISKLMKFSTAAATGFVDCLEKKGYVQRFHAQDDRRKVLVKITRKGQDLIEKYEEQLTKDLDNPESSFVLLMNNFVQLQQQVAQSSVRKFAAAS